VVHHELPAVGENVILRALDFRARLSRFWDGPRPVVQFRSIFEGYPLARNKARVAEALIFEVNGVPSIELKYHYPDVTDDRELCRKLEAQEDACLQAADRVVTPSAVTARYLEDRGVPASKIRVIPNGVDLATFSYAPPRRAAEGEPLRVLYSGTLSAWQGVRLAIEALALVRRDAPATLTLVGPTRGKQRKQIDEWCRDMGVGAHVTLLDPVPQDELARLHHGFDVIVAPLVANDRNVVQGCCPLKVLEAMASGTPLVSTDLPVVRALCEPDEHALLCRPGSAKALKDALLRVLREPDLGGRLSRAARGHIEARFTWEVAARSLLAVYDELGVARRASTSESAADSASR